MKRKFLISLLLCVCLFASFCSFASAQEAQLGYVTDTAGILSQTALDTLNDNAALISQYYGCGVYIVVVNDYRDYVNGDIAYFSETIYKSYALGEGEGKNGILLSLSMNDRDYDLCAYGDFANYAFTDYGKDQLADSFLDNFRRDDWEGGFNDYISNSGWILEKAKAGEPYDTVVYEPQPYTEPQRGIDPVEAFMMIFIPGGAAGVTVSRMKSRMKTAKKQTQAREYIGEGGARLSASNDQFLHSTETRQIIRQERAGGGGHMGGTHVNSGGFSHHSGKF